MLPVLHGAGFHLRELRRSDAASLFSMLTTEEVARFITPPPTSVEGFERFIDYTHRRRSQGEFACFAVVPEGLDTAIGIFQLRALDGEFSTAEWGFALGSPFWGTRPLRQGAALVMAFAFERRRGEPARGARDGGQRAGATARCARSARGRRRCCDSRWRRVDACTTSICGRSSRPTGGRPTACGGRPASLDPAAAPVREPGRLGGHRCERIH